MFNKKVIYFSLMFFIFVNYEFEIKIMDAIRQFIDVKNNTFQVTLPAGFNADRVEVIILPSEIQSDIPQWHKDILDQRLQEYIENPNDLKDFDTFCEELEKEL